MKRTEYRKSHWADLRSGDMYQGDEPEPSVKSGWWILPAVVMGLAIVWGLV